MARIIGGVAVSHTPTIGFAYDADKQDDPAWAPIFTAFEPVRDWFSQQRPDAIVYVFNDHVTSFFFDHYSAFTLGIGDSYPVADEGGGPRALPAVPGNPRLAQHIATSLVTDEFDMSFFQDRPLDHGFFSPMSVLLEHADGTWPTTVVPLQVGVLQFPIPSAARCFKLGQALRRAVESYPEDISVAVVATGGLSHQVHGERAGFNNTDWDRTFLDTITRDPATLAAMTHAEYAELGGLEGSEVIMWLIMRGALSENVRQVSSSFYLPSMTDIGTLVLENETADLPVAAQDRHRHRERMAQQLRGIDRLPGTYPFDLARSLKAYRLNKYLHAMIDPAHRARFLADPEASFDEAGLTDTERDLVRRRDWRAMIHYGVIFFVLEKLGAVVGTSNLHIYAAMRGESLDDFLATRNTKVLYSVSGSQATKSDPWKTSPEGDAPAT
ncbi:MULTISPECIES: gallate dioxygenase [Pseudofrankia]|uniref:gallate dioxygenase n=1 Tax=Pseudofrankia TaxID=2994363 RepID=UPI000234BF3E|nr:MULTISPECIES: gallate dioxygenase [Pseudofrankia]OHV32306.1 protocatechuate 3,4-dioxygenase [Pseudofrankia sp. EUN1h]